MKILFLDIDGVLNSEQWFKSRTKAQQFDHLHELDQEAVRLFDEIVERTGCKVVLSSTWRLSSSWRADLEAQGLNTNAIIDRTPHMPRPNGTGVEYHERGKEVQAWIDEHRFKCDHPTSCPKFTRAMCMGHKIKTYAILDDDSDFMPDQPLFRTTWKTGLTREIADKIIQHLTSTEV